MKALIIIVFFLSANLSFAQKNTSSTSANQGPKKFKPKKAVAFDFNSWSENLILKNGTASTDLRAVYYGFGASYDHTIYKADWGYGFLAGVAQGYGLAGQSANATTIYYEKRVPWTSLRGGARVFSRFNPRFDFGAAMLLQYRQISWRAENGYTPVAPTNPSTGFFVETRWRINYKFELTQSFGQYTKDTSMAWRIGTAYTLN